MSHRPRSRLWLRRCSFLAASAVPLAARADSNWNAGTGLWSIPGNWNPAGVPTSGANVIIVHNDASNRTVTFDFSYPTGGVGTFTLNNDGTGTNVLSLSQAGNRFASNADQLIATSGRGTVNHSAGTNFVGASLRLASGSSGVGLYALSNGATLTILGTEEIGESGRGTFNQTGGTQTVTGPIDIGRFAGASGTATLSGGTWNANTDFAVSQAGVGVFNQTGGVLNVTGGFSVGRGTGTANISGGALTAANLYIGEFKIGALNHSGGTVTASSSLFVGYNGGAVGTYAMSNNARLAVGVEETVGYVGAGTFAQTGGTHTAGRLSLGANPAGSGTSTLSGGTFTLTGNVTIGNAGHGVFNQSGGTMTAGGFVFVGLSAGSDGSFNLSNGTLACNRDLEVGVAGIGAFNQSGGTNTVGAEGFAVGSRAGGVGVYSMSNNATLTVNGAEYISYEGGSSGTFNQTGGTHNTSDIVYVGYLAGASGVANLSGGAWTATNGLTVGFQGAGRFSQSGGTFTTPAELIVGAQGGAATFIMSGGSFSAHLTNIGAGAGPAIMALADGVFSSPTITVYPNGTLDLAGAVISSNLIDVQGGTLRIDENTSVNSVSVGLGSSVLVQSVLTVTGAMSNRLGVTLGGAPGQITIAPGGSFNGFGMIIPSVSNAGNLTVQGGNLLLSSPIFVNSGTLRNSVGTNIFIQATFVTNTGSIVVNNGGAISFEGANLTNPAGRNITLNGGALAAPVLLNSGTVTGSGQFTGNFTNSASVTINGASKFFGNLRNQSTGTITVRNSQLLVTGTATNSGTIRVQLGGSVVFDAGLTGNPVGAASLDPFASMITPFIRQSSLSLSGNAGDPASFSLASIRPAAQGGDTSLLASLAIQTDASNQPLGKFDLADTALIVNYAGASPLASLRSSIISGYNPSGAHWTGPGITSTVAANDASKAIGYAEASDVLSPTGGAFAGQSADGTSVLVRFTLFGDANLDGSVDFNDLVRLAQNYNTTVSASTDGWWSHGDFTYDGIVDFNDLVKLAQNYNTALPTEPIPGAPLAFAQDLNAAFAPEPSMLAFIAGIGALRRSPRRRRHPVQGTSPP